MAEYHLETRSDFGTGASTGVVVGLFAAFGLGLAFIAFFAAFAIRDLTLDPQNVAAGLTAAVIGLLPFLAAPVIALIGGAWAGNAAKDGGHGALAGALGTLIGVVVMFILVGIGFALGTAASGFSLAGAELPENVAVPPNLATLLGYFATAAGIVYLLANAIIAAVSGALVGYSMSRAVEYTALREERAV